MNGRRRKRQFSFLKEIIGKPELEDISIDRSSFLQKSFLKIAVKYKILIPHGGSYIDLGCGNQPQNAIRFSKYFSEIFCLDISIENIKMMKDASKEIHNLFFIRGDAQNLPLRDSSFNAVSAFSLIEHMSDQRLFLNEINRILKEKGIFIMQFPNACFFIDLHTSLLFPQFVHNMLIFCFPRLSAIFPHNLTSKKAFAFCSSSFQKIYMEPVNYSQQVVSNKRTTRSIYGLLKKSRLLDICPLGFIFVCIK